MRARQFSFIRGLTPNSLIDGDCPGKLLQQRRPEPVGAVIYKFYIFLFGKRTMRANTLFAIIHPSTPEGRNDRSH
jgi:hypothetical protein